MVNSELQLPFSLRIEPEGLIAARQRVPVDQDSFIPLLIDGPIVAMVEPSLTRMGEGAIALSLGKPFGFRQGVIHSTVVLETQKTDGIILTRDPKEQDRWRAAVETAKPLSSVDAVVFKFGISFYLGHARL